MGGGLDRRPGGGSLVQNSQAGSTVASPGKRTLTEQVGGRSATLAEAGGGQLAARVGVDAATVRVHEDGVAEGLGARAVAKGRDLHFAKDELEGPDSEFLIGHELAHVVQQERGETSTQAKRAGIDGRSALESEADRVGHAVASGASVAGSIEGRATPGSPQKFDSFEHREIGDDATKGQHGETKTVELAPDYRVTYGELVALGGDFFGSIDEVRRLAAVPGKGAGTREEIDYVRRVKLPHISADEQAARTKEFSAAAVQAADKRYYKLAANNASHFANPETGDASKSTLEKANATHQEPDGVAFNSELGTFTAKLKTVPNNAAGYYRKNHLIAIGEAVAAGKANKSIDSAMAANAFSDHYLTDSFSAGHNRTARTSASQYWNAKEPMFFPNFKGFMAEKLAYYINDHNTLIGIASVDLINDKTSSTLTETLDKKGMPDFQFGDLVAGAIHDYDNEKGVAVKVDGVDKMIFGDDNLGKGDTKDVVVRAVQASVSDIEAAYEAGKAGQGYDALYAKIAPRGMFRSEELMPVVKPDAELAAADRSIKWDYPDVGGLIADPKFREGLKIFLAAKKEELANVGKTLDAAYKREAFENAIVSHMQGEEGIKMIWQILQWTPNTGGGIGGHNQDDNALAYFNKAKATPGGLTSLMWSARANLIRDLVDGATMGDEEDAIFELLTTCPSDGDVRQIINSITWDRLEDEVGDRFVKRYPKARYGKAAA
ncbi:MAG TPA: DUF4157 domain-containing protein [Kofleriaceae bacterium]|nr:DUF4157 domain-containing protein [Kofleriaceae bacterium]